MVAMVKKLKIGCLIFKSRVQILCTIRKTFDLYHTRVGILIAIQYTKSYYILIKLILNI